MPPLASANAASTAIIPVGMPPSPVGRVERIVGPEFTPPPNSGVRTSVGSARALGALLLSLGLALAVAELVDVGVGVVVGGEDWLPQFETVKKVSPSRADWPRQEYDQVRRYCPVPRAGLTVLLPAPLGPMAITPDRKTADVPLR